MAAGLSDHVWSLEEIVMMADNYMPKPAKRAPYNFRAASLFCFRSQGAENTQKKLQISLNMVQIGRFPVSNLQQ